MDNKKKMKWIFLGVGAVALTACVVAGARFLSRSRLNPSFDSDTVDGGVVKRNDGLDSPKVITSTEITSFECVFSLIAHHDEIELEHGVYSLNAAFSEGVVKGNVDLRVRGGKSDSRSFETEPSFMIKLQEIVAKYDFARYNGCTHTVSGLPDMYGMKLNICYASGEYIYTHDNQNNNLPLEAMYELNALFAEQCK